MIYYIYHSGFVVELKNNILIFDFYKFPIKQEKTNFLKNFINRFDKRIFVFSSHSHSDHFNKEILEWVDINKNIIYILSDDIEINNENKNIIFTKEGDKIEIIKENIDNLPFSQININTFGSTDLGVSFYINIEGINIFHAGDLHFWHWEDDTEYEEKEMKEKYISILEKIKELNVIDIAFIPVDPRLGVNVFEGFDIFTNILHPKIVIPMHFGKDYSAMDKFIIRNKNKDIKLIKIDNVMKKIMEL